MVKSDLITLYSFVWEPILRNNPVGHDLIEFAQKLPQLRKALSCRVCTQLLTNRVALCPSKCKEHFVCDGCKGKRRENVNKCGFCEDWDTFQEDETLYLLLRNYQDFCYYVLTTEQIVRLLEVKHEVDPTFDTFKLIELVSEGVKGSSFLRKRKLLMIPNEDRGVTPLSSVKRAKKVTNEATAVSTAGMSKQTTVTLAVPVFKQATMATATSKQSAVTPIVSVSKQSAVMPVVVPISKQSTGTPVVPISKQSAVTPVVVPISKQTTGTPVVSISKQSTMAPTATVSRQPIVTSIVTVSKQTTGTPAASIFKQTAGTLGVTVVSKQTTMVATSNASKQTTSVPTATNVFKQTTMTQAATNTTNSINSETRPQVSQYKLSVLEKTEKCFPQNQTPMAEKAAPTVKLSVSSSPVTKPVSNIITTTPTIPVIKNIVYKPLPQLPVSLVGKMGTTQTSSAPPPPVKVGINKVLSTPIMTKTVSVRNQAPLQGPNSDKYSSIGKIQLIPSATGAVSSPKITTPTTTVVSAVNKNVPAKPQTTQSSYFNVLNQAKMTQPQQQSTLPNERIIAVSKVQPLPSSSSAPVNVFSSTKVVVSDKTVLSVSSSMPPKTSSGPIISSVTSVRTPVSTTPSSTEKFTSVRVVPLPISTVEKVSSNRPQVQVSSASVNKTVPCSKQLVTPSPSRPVVETPKQLPPKVTTVGTGIPISGSKYIQIKVEPQQPVVQISKPNTPDVASPMSNMVPNDMFTNAPKLEDGEHILPHSPVKPTPLTTPASSKPAVTPVTSAPINVTNVKSLPFTLTPNLLSAAGHPNAQIFQFTHQGGVRTVSIRPQQMRITGNVTFQGRTLPVHIIGPSPPSEAVKQQIAQIAANQKFLFQSPSDMNPWPDHAKIIQVNASDLCRLPGFGSATIRPSSTVTVGPVSTATSTTTTPKFTSVNVRPVNTGSLVRPTTTNTSVSNVTSLSTNLNTMKTSTVSTQPSTSVQITRAGPNSTTSIGTTIIRSDGVTTLRQVPSTTPSSTCSSPATAAATASTTATSKRKQEGCGCGNATPNPGSGKLTCIGQRCACYADGNACSDCKCKGCKNPYLPGAGGKKVLHGGRALLDPQSNQSVPLVSSMAGGPSSSTMLPGATGATMNSSLPSNINFGPIQAGPSTVNHPSAPIQLIPIRFGQPSGLGQYIQITNAHALQQLPMQQIFFNSGNLPTSATGITIQGLPVSSLSGLHHQMAQVQQQQRPPPQMSMHMKTERSPNDCN